jgi:homoserine O-acetyltransferase
MKFLHILCLLASFSLPSLAQDGQQQFASLGDFKLQNGEVIHDCRIGFRTYGRLNADKSNVIVFTTWFGGRTEQLAGNFGPGKTVDTSRFYGVAIDALGNGVSSSPSNSKSQPRMKFPKFTVRDMVNSQHQLLTDVLHIHHVKAVVGISMGGMQVFQWMVSYPEFMDKAIPIMGSPRMAPYDILHWHLEMDAIMDSSGWNGGEYAENPAMTVRGEIGDLLLTTPEGYNRTMTRERVEKAIAAFQTEPRFDANNHIRQAQAAIALDISDAFGGSMERAAAAVKAQVLVIVNRRDHAVTPGEALAFARRINAQVLELSGDCGHQSNGCESDKVEPAIRKFLGE